MTNPTQTDELDFKAALEDQPDFHTHYEYHGKWAQNNRDLIQTALRLASRLQSGELFDQAYSNTMHEISKEHFDVINGDHVMQSIQAKYMQDFQKKGAHMMNKAMEGEISASDSFQEAYFK